MTPPTPRRLAAAFAVLSAIASPALALSTYSYYIPQSDYPAHPGDTLSIDVYLHQSTPAGQTPTLSSTGGLFSAGFRLTPLSPTDTTIQSLSPNSTDFDGAHIPGGTPTSPTLYEDRISGFPPGVSPDPAGLIKLGTLHLFAGPSNGTTTFLLSDPDPTTTEFLTLTALELDSTPGITPTTFTLTITPEPTTLSLLLPLLLPRRRR